MFSEVTASVVLNSRARMRSTPSEHSDQLEGIEPFL